MKRLDMLLVTAMASLALGGCATVEFEDRQWRLTEVDGAPALTASEERAPFIHFDRGPPPRVSGATGCNRFAGSYALDGATLTFGPLASTKMACPDGMEQERAILQALGDVREWRVVDGTLELLDERDAVRLVLDPAQPK